MELHRADPGTQTEVDLLIWDYLLCTSIHNLLYASRAEEVQPYECDPKWHIDTLHTIQSVLPHPEPFPYDLDIKVPLFEFADVFWCYSHQYLNLQPQESQLDTSRDRLPDKLISLSKLATTFISLCHAVGARLSETEWTGIATQFVIHAVLEEYRTSGFSASFVECIAWAEETLDQISSRRQASGRYMNYLQPPSGTPLNAHLDTISARFPLHQFKYSVFDVLIGIMKVLEPPVLIQLERGRLWGLSRAETQQLKDRVGLK
ncbi:hypothetical protein BBP40_003183 [Aspergillus hancockii]|nr:hypothetical protein BBP40_003183 [Aspergillus hancockii]